MENIVQAVESAITSAETHVEAEAKKVETAVGSELDAAFAKAHGLVTKLEEDAKAFSNHVVRLHLLEELEELTNKLRTPEYVIDPATAQAAKDAEEDAEAIRGAFSRFFHRLWKFI